MHFVGKDETGERMEIFELKEHPFFVGTQFHSEFQSRVLAPSVSLTHNRCSKTGADGLNLENLSGIRGC